MKLKKMKKLVEWANAKPEEFQETLQNVDSLELAVLADIPLTERQKTQRLVNFMRSTKIHPALMALEVHAYATEKGMDTAKPDEVTHLWIKSQTKKPEGFLTMKEVEQLKNLIKTDEN